MSKRIKFVALLCLFLLGVARLRPHYDAAKGIPDPETLRLARSLALDGQFANPFRLAKTGPSAYLSPGFPAFLALLIRIFGTGPAAAYAMQLSAAVACSAQLAILPVLAESLGLGWFCGIIACLIGLLPPILTFPDWEMSYAGLLIVLATILWTIFLKDTRPLTSSLILGAVSGLLLLTTASAFAVWAAWSAYALWRFRHRILQHHRWAALAIPLAILAPWTARNYVVFHRFAPFRTALGLALSVSNNDCASVGVRQSEASGCLALHSPNFNLEEAERAQAVGEAEYNREKFQQVTSWIAAHPQRFTSLTLQRVLAFWFPFESSSPLRDLQMPGRRKERFTIYVMTALSIPGLIVLWTRNSFAAYVLGSWLVFFPGIYYVALFEDRYRYPILWVTLICGSYALCSAGRTVAHLLQHGNKPDLKVGA